MTFKCMFCGEVYDVSYRRIGHGFTLCCYDCHLYWWEIVERPGLRRRGRGADAYWALIAAGLTQRQAACICQVSPRTAKSWHRMARTHPSLARRALAIASEVPR